MMKIKKECVGGCGKYIILYFHRRTIFHSALNSFHRLVNIGGQGLDRDIPELMSAAFKSFPDYYRKLVHCESISSMSTGEDITPTIRPTAVITDVRFLFHNLLEAFIDS